MKRLLLYIISILSCVVFTGCTLPTSNKYLDPDLVGTWNYVIENDSSKSSSAEGTESTATDTSENVIIPGYTFNEDLTGYDGFWDAAFTYSANSGILTITYDEYELLGEADYKYVIKDDKVTITRNTDDGVDVTYTKEPEPETEGETNS